MAKKRISKTKEENSEYQMPKGAFYEERERDFQKIRKDERYWQARKCVHCTDLADSFGRWTCTYCHVFQTALYGLGADLLDKCKCCEKRKGR